MNDNNKRDLPKYASANKPLMRRGRGGMGQGMALSAPAEKAKDFKGTVRRLLSFLRPQAHLLLIMLLFIIFVTLISVITPNFTRQILNTLQAIIDGTAPQNSVDLVKRLFILTIILYVIGFLMEAISYLLGNYVSANVGKGFRNVLREKLERLPIKYYDENQTGNILSVFANDVDVVTMSLQQSIIMVLQSFLTIIGVLVMMFVISWKLTLITLVLLPLYVLTTTVIAKRSQKRFIRQQNELGNLNGYIEEMYSAHKIVKLFNKEEDSYQDFSKVNDRLATENRIAQFLSGLIRPIMDFISNIGYVAVVIVGGILAGMVNPILIGDIAIFVTYHRRFMNPILNIANLVNMLQSAVAGAERIFDLLDASEEVKEQDIVTIDLDEVDGRVTFEGVDFSYTEGQDLIEDLSLEALPGKQIAIVGPTGAGKTTLVNLLMRFYEIGGGTIKIDDVPSTDLRRSELRKMFGMVLQDTWLFSGTIRDNVAYGRDDASMEEIIEACKQAHVHHFIETLPKGYDTILNEDASNISQGQKQLLTIARAILSNPRILILDEATSSVDTRTEAYIQNAMKYMSQGKTSFVIAHRLSTIKRASTIIVMNHGKIIEQGSHEELLARKGFYHDMYQSQFNYHQV